MMVLPRRRRQPVALHNERSSRSSDVPETGVVNGTIDPDNDGQSASIDPPRPSLMADVTPACEQPQSLPSFQNMVGVNAGMRAMFELIGKIAHAATTVLIEGETGTGKELVAQAI